MAKYDEYREKFIEQKRIEDVSENHIVFFVLFFVETYCMDLTFASEKLYIKEVDLHCL